MKGLLSFTPSVVFVAIFIMFAPAFGADQVSFQSWIQQQRVHSEHKMFANISRSDTAPGSIVASPSRHDPNYFYYWVRDGALTMNTVYHLFERSNGAEREGYFKRLDDFRAFSRKNQLQRSPFDVGDPRYNADGTLDTQPWGRPQNDGPALRALTFIRFANALIKEGKRSYVEEHLYNSRIPSDSLIKIDLEYTAHHWFEKNIDLWEEVRGHHFFTRAAQYAALVEGAKLAEKLGDSGAAAFYNQTAQHIERALHDHWSDEKGYFLQTLDIEWNPTHQKPTQLDVATIIAVLAVGYDDGILSPLSDKIMSSARALEQTFSALYPINSDKTIGTAIGRYPEDHYYGGNPWFLTTAAFAEYHYRVARVLNTRSSYFITERSLDFFQSVMPGDSRIHVGANLVGNAKLKRDVMSALKAKGDTFLARIRRHTATDGSMSEQIKREDGFMTSAENLTWSYASFIDAIMEREEAP